MKKITLLALVLPGLALANGYDVPNVNPRDLAMAGANTAAQVDAAAAYANPAALSRLDGLNLSLGASILMLSTTWNGPPQSSCPPAPAGCLAGRSASTEKKPAPPVSLFAAYGFKLADRNAGVGFGMNVPGGGNVFWPNDWDGRGRIITVDRKIYGFYLTGGYEVLKDLRFGGGIIYYYGTEYLKQGVQPSNDSYGELSTTGGAFSFDLSGEYRLPSIPLTLGADYKYRGEMRLKGNGKFVVPDATLPTVPPPVDQGVTHDLTYPDVLNLAASYQVTKPLLLTLGFTWNNYSLYQSDLFVGSLGTSIEVPRHYSDGYTIRVGGEYELNPKLKLRAGILRDFSGLNATYASATLPDSNAWAGALGAGWKITPDLSLEGSFFYAWLDKVTVQGNVELPGSYKSDVWILSLGATWRTDLGGGR
jgi:long-chain fatty acid transport protein